MKKIILVIVFILGFNNAALSLSWERNENRINVKLPGNTYGYTIGEGQWGSKLEEFPNCKKLNKFPGKGLRQGNKTFYDFDNKIMAYEKGLFDCIYFTDEIRFRIVEGISEDANSKKTLIYFKRDNFNQYIYSYNNNAWSLITLNKDYALAHQSANLISRETTREERDHAERLLVFYKKIDLSSRNSTIFNNIINTNFEKPTSNSNIKPSVINQSSNQSKLPNCVGSFNEKTWTNCYGIYKWSNPNDKYDGEFLNGNRHGFGTYFYANGNKYTGEWNNDRPNGKGTMIFASGAKYIGEVKNGKRHGQGSYFYSDGERLTGKWNEGEFVDSSSYKKLENDNSNFYKKSKSTENAKLRSSSGVKEYWWVVILLIGIIFFVYTQTKKDLNINTERSFKPKIRETHNIITQFVEGKKSLGFSFWIAYALLTTINFFLFSILDDYAAKNNLNSLIPQIFAWVVIGCYIFSCIGSWKSATNYKLQKIRTKEPFVWATAAYVTIVVMSILLGLGVIQGFLEAI
jgi:hypothetical protein